MEIEVIEDADIISITVNGSIEMENIRDFKKKLLEICQNTDKDAVIDLSKVNYIDSSGIAVLITLLKHQTKNGKSLNIKKISTQVFNVLKLSSLSDAFGC